MKEQADVVLMPALDRSGGLIVTQFPGHLTWNFEESVLVAKQGTDIIPHTQFRYHYRPSDEDTSPNLLMLFRVEKWVEDLAPNGSLEWQSVWEAPQWATIRAPHPD